MNTRTYRNPSHHLVGPGPAAPGPVLPAARPDSPVTLNAELAAGHAESTADRS
ncbi:hypothetical protein ACFV4P_09000 [Kitasatospora sp. NPDC059795]|uniref:hypothetical protein n=1 Tax=Kitasatospora sp. NPDC059795 TaxID=3346949 RepID=UPI003653156C